MATVEELKEMIVELKVDLAKANIPYGNCPYAYYPGVEGGCVADIACSQCKQEFWQRYRVKVEEWVENL